MSLPTRVAVRCFLRTPCINAAMTTRGMQGIGLCYVLAPALRHLFQDPAARARAFGRYAEYSNTHVFMLPAYAGLLISMEEQIAAGTLSEGIMTTLRQTLATTLSALGDGFFSGSLRSFWSLACICLILKNCIWTASAFTLLLLFLLWAFRTMSFFYCLKNGISVLQWLRKIDLITCSERIKYVNAGLIGLALWFILNPGGPAPGPWQEKAAILAFIPATSWLVGRIHIPRMLIWILALGFFVLLDEGFIHV